MRHYLIFLYTFFLVVVLLLAATIAAADTDSAGREDSTVALFDGAGNYIKSVATHGSALGNERGLDEGSALIHCSEGEHLTELHVEATPFPSDRETTVSLLPSWRVLDLLVVASPDFLQGRSESDSLSDISETIGVANRYLRDLKLTIRLVGVQLVSDSDTSAPYAEAIELRDGYKMLQALKHQWADRPYPRRDATVVIAASRFRDTFGLAYTGASCVAPQSSYIFVTKGGIERSVGFGATLAHELGHFVGMSHDGNPVGLPSLMWPTHIEHANGFSPASVAQYLQHAAVGSPGGSCFKPQTFAGAEVPPAVEGELQFAEGLVKYLTVREGEFISIPLTVSQHESLVGVRYRAEGLPSGAELNPFTGVFVYKPPHSLARRRQQVTIPIVVTAEMLGAQAALSVILNITDVNQPPEIEVTPEGELRMEQGSAQTLSFQAVDPDLNQKIRSFKILNARELKQSGFKIRRVRRDTIALSGAEVAIGSYLVQLIATDSERGTIQRDFTVYVEPPRKLLSAVAALSQLGGVSLQFSPEVDSLDIDLLGAPVGSQLWYLENGIEFFSPTQISMDSLEMIAEGSEITIFPTFLSPGGWQTALPEWPGAGRSEAVSESNYLVYQPSSGFWSTLSCQAVTNEKIQFGGFNSDVPINLLHHGLQIPGIVRTQDGALWWFSPEQPPQQFGLSEDIPFSGDIDGDGESDFSVFRATERSWYLKSAASGGLKVKKVATRGGESPRIIPFLADVDGDEKAEPIVFERLSNGLSRFRVMFLNGREVALVVAKLSGEERAVPFAIDIDRDGRVDLGILRGGSRADIYLSSSSAVRSFPAPGATDLVALDCDGAPAYGVKTADTVTVRDMLTGGVLSQYAISIGSVTSAEFSRRRAAQASSSMKFDFDGDRISDRAVWSGDDIQREILVSHSSGLNSRWGGVSDPSASLLSRSRVGEAAQPVVFAGGMWTFPQDTAQRPIQWGVLGDAPVMGDFNGDGDGDLGVFRSQDGSWWFQFGLSESAPQQMLYWGQAGDIPVVGDFDGDTVSDVAVYRPSTATLYVRTLAGGVMVRAGGDPDGVPVVGDFYGEGRSNLGLWNSELAQFSLIGDTILRSFTVGLPGDLALSGNFDGAVSEELVLMRPATTEWFSFGLGVTPLNSASLLPFGEIGALLAENALVSLY